MSADSIVYCLENLTDYDQFERLCSDVMTQTGYPDIEPLGGSNDRGRDALHVSRTDPNEVTIFAYSVRGDWRQKLLNEDCKRIHDERHELDQLVFVSTASITSTQKDKVKQEVVDKFDWNLEIYDLERLRIRLAGDLRHLIAQHPSIFCPPFFPTRGGLSVAEARDTLVIDHHPDSHALATWLARRLQLAGHQVWCYGTAPLAGENPDDSIRALIRQRACRFLPIVSTSSLADSDFLARCSIASETDGLVLPCHVIETDLEQLPRKFTQLASAGFSKSWADGLSTVIDCLNATSVSPSFSGDQGRAIALRSYVPEPVVKQQVETVYSNTFAVTVPSSIQVCELERALDDEQQEELRKEWAFVVANATTYLAFESPPASVPLAKSKRLAGYSWKHYSFKHDQRSTNVVKELVRRSLDLACLNVGLLWCENRKKFYFPQGTNPLNNLSYVHVDGRKTRVSATGQKSYGSGDRAKPFRYQLCPTFRVGQDESGAWWATMRIYVRITDLDGQPYEKKGITRRRKKVANNWWNREWFARTLAIMQSLANGETEIVIGSGSQRVAVSVEPLQWDCPVAIDYAAVDRIGDFQEEIAALRFSDDEDDTEADDDAENEEEAGND